jgi:hypothetical protein
MVWRRLVVLWRSVVWLLLMIESPVWVVVEVVGCGCLGCSGGGGEVHNVVVVAVVFFC